MWTLVAVALALVMVLTSLFLPWGTKAVVEEHCDAHWQTGRQCDHADLHVTYFPLRMDVEGWTWHTSNDQPDDERRVQGQWGHRATPAHPDGASVLLLAGGPLMVAGAVAMTAASCGTIGTPRAVRTWIARVALGGWAGSAVGLVAFLAGMAYHAFTWSAADVDAWRPGWGLVPGLAAVASGSALLRWRSSGPSAPIPELPRTGTSMDGST